MKLNTNELKFLLVSTLFTVGNALSAVFVNVFLYVYTKSLVVMSLYTCIVMGLYPPLYYIAGKLACRKNFGISLSLGLVFLMLHLIFILFFNNLFGTYRFLVYVAAVICGIGEGFYWLSVGALKQFISTPASFGYYMSVSGIFGNLARLFAPLLATLIIDLAHDDMQAYITIFKLVAFIYFIVALISFTLKIEGANQPFTVKDKWDFKDIKCRYMLLTNFISGVSDAIPQTLGGLLIFNATGGSGSLYSKLLALFALIGISTYMYIAKRLNLKTINKWYGIGAVLLASSTLILALVPNIYGAIYYGIVNAISSPMYTNAFTLMTMRIVASYKNDNQISRVIVRSCGQSAGRCVGKMFIVVLFYLLKEPYYLPTSVIILSAVPLILFAYHKKTFPLFREML